VFSKDPAIGIPLTDPGQVAHLRSAWLRAIRDHPLDYLAVRAELWGRQASITGPPYQAVDSGLRPTPIGYNPYFPDVVKVAVDYAKWWTADPTVNASGGLVHTVWAYLLIALLAMVWMARRPSPINRVFVLLGAGSLLYTLGMFFAATSLQYRYSLPCVYAGMVLGIALVSDWFQTTRRRYGRARARGRPAPSRPRERELVGAGEAVEP
jgi:heme A synthase